MIHYLKCWPKHFTAVKAGVKPFELRYNDRDYQVGDTLVLQEWVPADSYKTTRAGWYTGQEVQRLVTYILDEFEEMPEFTPDGWVVMGLRGD